MHVYSHLFATLGADQGDLEAVPYLRSPTTTLRTTSLQIRCPAGQVRNSAGQCVTLPGRIQTPCPAGQVRNYAGRCVTLPGRISVPQRQRWSMSASFGANCYWSDVQTSRIGSISLPEFFGTAQGAQNQAEKYAADYFYIFEAALTQTPKTFVMTGFPTVSPGQILEDWARVTAGEEIRYWTPARDCKISNIRVTGRGADGQSVSAQGTTLPTMPVG
jgi:hypothetical protein